MLNPSSLSDIYKTNLLIEDEFQPQMENTKIIQDLRDEISRLREKVATTGRAGGASKDDVLQMEVKRGAS